MSNVVHFGKDSRDHYLTMHLPHARALGSDAMAKHRECLLGNLRRCIKPTALQKVLLHSAILLLGHSDCGTASAPRHT